jgi:hypothetical protein
MIYFERRITGYFQIQSSKKESEMPHCQGCGAELELLIHGSCGGNGAVYGCWNCDRLFRQTTGGILATPEGETLSPMEGSYREMKAAIERREAEQQRQEG